MTHVVRHQQHDTGQHESGADPHENSGADFGPFGVLPGGQALQVAKNGDFAGQDEDSAQNPENAEKCAAPGHRWYEAARGPRVCLRLDSRKPAMVV